MAGHWADVARQWDQVGPPLRPAPIDLGVYRDVIDRWARDHGPPRALILGVTPELYRLPWPGGTRLLAMDHTPAMIDALWPGPRQAVICADWTEMPLAARSCDVVLCDGGLHLMAYPQAQEAFAAALRRVVAPDGVCIVRLFVPPARRETPHAVLRDLRAGRIATVNLLKLRLWAALQDHAAEGVALRCVWETLHRVEPDFGRLAARLGWPPDHLAAVNTYRDSDGRYHLIGVEAVRNLFCERIGGFSLERVHVPAYDLGDRCPIVVLRRDAEACS